MRITPFRVLALSFLLWITALRVILLLVYNKTSVSTGLRYLLVDHGVALLILVPVALLLRPDSWVSRLVAGIWLGLCTLIYDVCLGVLAHTGTLFDYATLRHCILTWADVSQVLASEITWLDIFGFVMPGLLLAWALFGPPLFQRLGLGASQPGVWRGVAKLLVAALLCQLVATWATSGEQAVSRLRVSLWRPMIPVGMWADLSMRPVQASAADPKNFPLPEPEEVLGDWSKRPANAARPNFLVILLESVRASATSMYPPHLKSTPFLAGVAKDALVFEHAYAHAPHTGKAVFSTFSGHAPEGRSGSTEVGNHFVAAIPSRLADLGYATAFFDPSTQYFEARRLLYEGLGFRDVFAKEALLRKDQNAKTPEIPSYLGLEDGAVIEPMLRWLDANRGKPFCIGHLTLCTHHDYRTPTHWTKQTVKHNNPTPYPRTFERYLNAIRYNDDVLRQLWQRLEAGGYLKDTIVVITGDHGEGFAEHGRMQHADNLWQEGTHVPLIVYGPKKWLGPPRRIGGVRQHMDIARTIAQLMGVPGQTDVPTSPLVGHSLLTEPPADRTIYMRTHVPNSLLASRRGPQKAIYLQRFGKTRIYDLAADPWEETDLSQTIDPEVRAEIVGAMVGFQRATVELFERAATSGFRAGPKLPANLAVEHLFDGALRLTGVRLPKHKLARRLPMHGLLEWEFVFQVERDLGRDLRVEVRFEQAGRPVDVPLARMHQQLDAAWLKAGRRVAFPAFFVLKPGDLSPGQLSVRVRLTDAKGGAVLANPKARSDGWTELFDVTVVE